MWRLLLLVVTLLLSACTQYPKQPAQLDASTRVKWTQQAKALEKIQHWQLQGRMGIRSPGRALSATIAWQQNNETFDIQLSGPLGQGALHLNGNPAYMTLQRGQEKITSSTPQQSLNQELGTFLPLKQTRYWVMGHPGQTEPRKAHFDQDGRLLFFEAQGWQISYSDYQQVKAIALPHKIVLQDQANKITLLVNNWNIY